MEAASLERRGREGERGKEEVEVEVREEEIYIKMFSISPRVSRLEPDPEREGTEEAKRLFKIRRRTSIPLNSLPFPSLSFYFSGSLPTHNPPVKERKKMRYIGGRGRGRSMRRRNERKGREREEKASGHRIKNNETRSKKEDTAAGTNCIK